MRLRRGLHELLGSNATLDIGCFEEVLSLESSKFNFWMRISIRIGQRKGTFQSLTLDIIFISIRTWTPVTSVMTSFQIFHPWNQNLEHLMKFGLRTPKS